MKNCFRKILKWLAGKNYKKTEKQARRLFISLHEGGTLGTQDGTCHRNNYVAAYNSLLLSLRTKL